MLLHRAAPLLVGTAAIAALVYGLAQSSPMPAELASPHARIEGAATLEGCTTCHAPGGLSEGCASCHGEIAAQLAERTGLHAKLVGQGEERRSCAPCHPEHKGADFELVSEASWGAQAWRGFRHTHVRFGLKERHAEIACEECHGKEQRAAFAAAVAVEAPVAEAPLPPVAAAAASERAAEAARFAAPSAHAAPPARERTFLGLTQACEACHADPHAGGLSGDCARCHGQRAFEPPTFDHSKKFPLEGPHALEDCNRCHLIPDPLEARASGLRRPRATVRPAGTSAASEALAPPFETFPFDHARGTTCDGCHDTPHQAFTTQCDRCHPGADPTWGTAMRRMTVALHDEGGFHLRGAHAEVVCEKCHARERPLAERYPDRGAPGYLRREETCQGCHQDPHAGQFAARHAGCLDCHETGRFAPPTFDLEKHASRFPLVGAHTAVACTSCHAPDPALGGARRFADKDHACRSCHESPHGPQFAKKIAEKDCTACHDPGSTTFKIRPFDHLARTGTKLEGAHYHMAKCESCHVPVLLAFAGKQALVRRYEGTPAKECQQCHRDTHRGQFDLYGKEQCNRCHASSWSWKETRFVHDTMSRFKLEGAHAQVACDRCHEPQKVADGTQVIQYRPLGMECRSCHDIPKDGK